VRKHYQERKVGGPKAQKLWRLVEVGTASRIARSIVNAGAEVEASEVV
jgi:hypothetical protein